MSEEKMKSDDQVDARDEAYERFWQDFGAKGHKVSEKMLEQLYDAGYEAALQPLDDETGLKDAREICQRMIGEHRLSDAEDKALTLVLEAWNRRQGSLDGGWVDAKERLPENDGFYLVTWFDQSTKGPKVFAGYWTHGEFRVVIHWRNETTTWSADAPLAWREFPPPFVAGESDSKEEK